MTTAVSPHTYPIPVFALSLRDTVMHVGQPWKVTALPKIESSGYVHLQVTGDEGDRVITFPHDRWVNVLDESI